MTHEAISEARVVTFAANADIVSEYAWKVLVMLVANNDIVAEHVSATLVAPEKIGPKPTTDTKIAINENIRENMDKKKTRSMLGKSVTSGTVSSSRSKLSNSRIFFSIREILQEARSRTF
jgi:hypothetical protein